MKRLSDFAQTFAVISCLIYASQARSQTRHWSETANETIWTGRYSNCDHGYYINLPSKVVGHSLLPPSPNHGFQVDLANPASPVEASPNSLRTIWVWDSIGFESDAGTTKSVEAFKVAGLKGETDGLKFLRRTFLRVGGEKAVYIHSSLQKNGEALFVDDIVVFSPNATMEYRLRLITPRTDYVSDKRLFEQLVAGFRFVDIPPGECSND